MKKLSLLTLLILMNFNLLKAQQQEKVILKAGASHHAFKMEHVYRYPAFISSKVVYKDGVTTTEKLNYNQISDKMEFISPKGDTLVATSNNDIRVIYLDKSVYYYNEGYFELIKETPFISLARKISLKLLDKQKIGAFGMPSSTTAMDSYDRLPSDPYNTKLKLNIDYIFSKTVTYYFTDNNIAFLPATPKNLLKMTKEKKENINNYLKTKQVDFKSREEIENLINYLQSL